MPGTLILKNAKIVTPAEIVEGAIYLCDGQIADVQPGPLSLPAALDLEGDFLIPGLIDIHTDNLEKHIMPRNNAAWPVLSAMVAHDAQVATAGITTVLDSLCVGTAGLGVRCFEVVKETIAALEVGQEKRMFRSEHLLHLRAELSNEEMPRMFLSVYKNPKVRLVSLMDHTPGQRQWADLEKYIAMEKKDYKLSQAEIDAFLERTREGHEKFSQPNRRELLAMVEGLPIALASHDDTTVEHVEQAHVEGIGISEFPTTLVAAEAARDKGMSIVAGSPNLILGRSHSGNVSAGELARRGLLDVLSSDYAPASLLQGAFLVSEKLDLPLHETLRMVTLHPSRLVGLEDRGSIEIGKRADLVRVKQVENIPLPLMIWRQGMRIA
jgi:alpha-D-ribose 1-methylphosphonate 5-triphosphate diphosphatase